MIRHRRRKGIGQKQFNPRFGFTLTARELICVCTPHPQVNRSPFGDSTDGSLARFRKIERPRYGYFLDHSCDGLATTLVVVGIGLGPYVTLEVALIALAIADESPPAFLTLTTGALVLSPMGKVLHIIQWIMIAHHCIQLAALWERTA